MVTTDRYQGGRFSLASVIGTLGLSTAESKARTKGVNPEPIRRIRLRTLLTSSARRTHTTVNAIPTVNVRCYCRLNGFFEMLSGLTRIPIRYPRTWIRYPFDLGGQHPRLVSLHSL